MKLFLRQLLQLQIQQVFLLDWQIESGEDLGERLAEFLPEREMPATRCPGDVSFTCSSNDTPFAASTSPAVELA